MSTDWSNKEHPDTLVLFDVDGTLTPARLEISPAMKQALADLRKKVVVGFVGGSDLSKQKEQLGENGKSFQDHHILGTGRLELSMPIPMIISSVKLRSQIINILAHLCIALTCS
jgi:phosphomannomutase